MLVASAAYALRFVGLRAPATEDRSVSADSKGSAAVHNLTVLPVAGDRCNDGVVTKLGSAKNSAHVYLRHPFYNSTNPTS